MMSGGAGADRDRRRGRLRRGRRRIGEQEQRGGALGKVKSVADSSITSTIAGRIVDFVSKSDIDAATAKIAKAEKDINAAKGTRVRATQSGAEKGFAASLIAIKKASVELENKMKLREAALMSFGNAAAAAGGSEKEQDRVRGIVQAMPVVERVIASTDNMQAAIKVPAHSDNAGRGLNLALYGGLRRRAALPAHRRADPRVQAALHRRARRVAAAARVPAQGRQRDVRERSGSVARTTPPSPTRRSSRSDRWRSTSTRSSRVPPSGCDEAGLPRHDRLASPHAE